MLKENIKDKKYELDKVNEMLTPDLIEDLKDGADIKIYAGADMKIYDLPEHDCDKVPNPEDGCETCESFWNKINDNK